MPFSPLISKIRCHSPNRPGSKNANRNNIKYIATRSGVDISNLKENESINDLLRQDKNWTKKSMNEDKFSSEADNDIYMRYIAERPRSHGLFGNIDTTDLDKVTKDIYDLTKNGKNIYRGIISLSQKDAEMLGFTNKDSWNIYLRSVMPDICKELGISTVNFSWVAAYHAEKTHPHIHFQLWDNNDRVKSPFIHSSRQSNIRLMLSKQMFNDEYENFVKELTKPERDPLNEEKNQKRNELTNFLKDVFINFTEYVPGVDHYSLPEKIENKEISILASQLINLIDHKEFPKSGSLDYTYLPPNVKEEVRNICDSLLKRYDFHKSFDRYIDLQKEISKLNGKTTYEIDKSVNNAKKDIYSRMGNIIMRNCKGLLDKKEYLYSLTNYSNNNKEYITNESNYKDNIVFTNFEKNKEELSNTMWTDNLKHAMELYDSQDYDSSLKLFVKSAVEGNSIALQKLGDMYSQGLGVDENYDLATSYYKMAFSINNELNINEESPALEILEHNIDTTNYDTSKIENLSSLWDDDIKEALKLFYDQRNYPEAIKLFTKCSANGNPIALEKLGLIYSKGIGVEARNDLAKNYYDKAFKNYNKLLELKNEKMSNYVYYRLGKLYENGLGTNIDYDKAKYCYSIAVNAENKYAMYSLGRIYLDGKGIEDNEDIEKYKYNSFNLIKESADMKFSYASYQTGTFYMQGIFTNQNIEIAQKYYSEAYKGFEDMLRSYEDDNVLYRLGQMTYQGFGTEKDIEKAINYLEKAVELKNENAILLLSKIYIELENNEKLSEVMKLLTDLSENGSSRAAYSLGRIYATKGLFQDIEKAIYYYEIADKENNEHAQYGLGKIYVDKKSSFFDEEKAIYYFNLSSDHGNSYAQYGLGKIYSDVDSKYFDFNTALNYFTQSASNGNEHAAYSLGRIYSDTASELFDMEKAIPYLEQASNCNHLYAIMKLAQIYEDETLETYSNLELSNSYYEKAFHILDDNISKTIDYNDYTLISGLYLDGKGVTQDIEKGLYYLTEAADHDNANAQYRLGKLFIDGSLFEKNEEQAIAYLEKAVENDYGEAAYYTLGKVYSNKENDCYDLEKAIQNFEMARPDENQHTQYALGKIYADRESILFDEEKAIEYFTMSADQDNSYAQYSLGKIYSNEESSYYDMATSIDYFTQSASKDNEHAAYSLGRIYSDTASELFDMEKAIPYLEQASNCNHLYAIMKLAQIYEDETLETYSNLELSNSYYEKAFHILDDNISKTIDYNDYTLISGLYLDGKGVTQDIEKGLYYLTEAADHDNANAQYRLGKLFIDGSLFEKNEEQAIAYLEKAVENDYGEAAYYTLGKVYSNKENDCYDLEKAIQNFEMTRPDENQHTQYALGKIYADRESILFDEEKAIEYFTMSADQDNSYAQYSLGKIYSNEESSYYDMATSIDYFTQSASKDNEHAAYSLGRIYSDTASELFDMEKAIPYLEQASNCNHLYAIMKLAQIHEDETIKNYFNQELSNFYYEKAFLILEDSISKNVDYNDYTLISGLYLDGKGVTQDIEKGLYYLTEAADHDNANAQYKLGRMYLWGEHLSKNEEKGLEYLNKAATNGNLYAEEAIKFYEDFKLRQSAIVAYDVF